MSRSRTMRITRILSLVACLLLIAACTPTEPPPAVQAPPPPSDAEFDGAYDLLGAVEDGTFAERAGLEDEIAALKVPDTVIVDFVSGTQVPGDQAAKIERIAEALQADSRLRVDVIGCSDPTGSESLNLRISESRATSVAERMRALGVAEAQLVDINGLGESCEVQERMVRIVPSLAAPRG